MDVWEVRLQPDIRRHIYETVKSRDTGSGVLPTAHGGTGGSIVAKRAKKQKPGLRNVPEPLAAALGGPR